MRELLAAERTKKSDNALTNERSYSGSVGWAVCSHVRSYNFLVGVKGREGYHSVL